MGYTHYWYTNREGDQRAYSEALLDIAEIIRHSPVPLAGNHGDGEPQFTDSYIGFNGRDDLGCPGASCRYCGGPGATYATDHDQAHETCLFETVLSEIKHPSYESRPDDELRFGPGDWHFECCKTAQKPYDVIVTACLARLAECGPRTVVVHSDGEPADWEAGVKLASIMLGRPIAVPSGVTELQEA